MIWPARPRLWGTYLDEVAVHSDPSKRFPPGRELNNIIQAHAFKTYGQDNNTKRVAIKGFQRLLKGLRYKYRNDPTMDLHSEEFFTRLATASWRWWESKGQAEYEKLMGFRKRKRRNIRAGRARKRAELMAKAEKEAAAAANEWRDPLFGVVQDVITGNTWEGEYARTVLGEKRKAPKVRGKVRRGTTVEVVAARGQDKPFHGMRGDVVDVRPHFVTVNFPALGEIDVFTDSVRLVEHTELEGWPAWVVQEDLDAVELEGDLDTGY